MLDGKNRKSKISLSQAQLCCWLDTQETISHALSPKDLCKLWMARKEFTLILHVKWKQRVGSSKQKKKSAHKTWKNPPEKSHVFHTGRRRRRRRKLGVKHNKFCVTKQFFDLFAFFPLLFAALDDPTIANKPLKAEPTRAFSVHLNSNSREKLSTLQRFSRLFFNRKTTHKKLWNFPANVPAYAQYAESRAYTYVQRTFRSLFPSGFLSICFVAI